MDSSEKVSKFLDAVDKAEDPSISKQKFKEILEKSIGQQLTDEEFEEMMKNINVNENGNVLLSSFVKTVLDTQLIAAVPLEFEQLENLFKILEEHEDEPAGVQEWQIVLDNLGIKLTEAEVYEVMDMACEIMKQMGVVPEDSQVEVRVIGEEVVDSSDTTEHPEDEEPDDGQSEDAQSEDAQPEDAQSEDPQSEDPQFEDAQSEDAQSEDAQPEDAQPNVVQPEDGLGNVDGTAADDGLAKIEEPNNSQPTPNQTSDECVVEKTE